MVRRNRLLTVTEGSYQGTSRLRSIAVHWLASVCSFLPSFLPSFLAGVDASASRRRCYHHHQQRIVSIVQFHTRPVSSLGLRDQCETVVRASQEEREREEISKAGETRKEERRIEKPTTAWRTSCINDARRDARRWPIPRSEERISLSPLRPGIVRGEVAPPRRREGEQTRGNDPRR